MQECYSSEEVEEVWKKDWGGQILFSHGSLHSRGTLTLFRENLDVNILDQYCDTDGRVVLCKTEIEGQIYTLLNLYAPNSMGSLYMLISCWSPGT